MMDNGNEVIDKEMDVIDLLLTVRQMKTFIQKNFIDWEKLKTEVPKDEAKRVIKMGSNDEKATYRVKNKKREEKYVEEKECQEMELVYQKEDSIDIIPVETVNAPKN